MRASPVKNLSLVDIIIVNYNTLDLLRTCLSNLLDIGFDSANITVVDNNSIDGSREWLMSDQSPPVRVLLSAENLGFAGGNNLGISATSSRDYVLLLNTDAFPVPGSIEHLLTVLIKKPRTAVVGPQLLYPNGKWQRSTGNIPSPSSAMLDAIGITTLQRLISQLLWPMRRYFSFSSSVEYVDGACMLIRRSVLEQIGYLDESLFFFVEDAEFCARVQDNGYKVRYVPNSVVFHLRGGSSSQKNRRKSLEMKRDSLRKFINLRYGFDGWVNFCNWTYANYQVRYFMCRIFMLLGFRFNQRCDEYLEAMNVFRKEVVSSP